MLWRCSKKEYSDRRKITKNQEKSALIKNNNMLCGLHNCIPWRHYTINYSATIHFKNVLWKVLRLTDWLFDWLIEIDWLIDNGFTSCWEATLLWPSIIRTYRLRLWKVTTSHRLFGHNTLTASLHPAYISQHGASDSLFFTSIKRHFASIL